MVSSRCFVAPRCCLKRCKLPREWKPEHGEPQPPPPILAVDNPVVPAALVRAKTVCNGHATKLNALMAVKSTACSLRLPAVLLSRATMILKTTIPSLSCATCPGYFPNASTAAIQSIAGQQLAIARHHNLDSAPGTTNTSHSRPQRRAQEFSCVNPDVSGRNISNQPPPSTSNNHIR